MTHAEETQGLPSASGLERIVLCPGSWQLEQQCPVPEDTDDSRSGTRIHLALSGDQAMRDALTDDERETFDMCESLAGELLSHYQAVGVQREKRLWLYSAGFKRLFSGKFDRLYLCGANRLVIDFKTGRNEVAPAESNWQLRALAVLVAENYYMDPDAIIYVATIQPWTSPQVTVAEYEVGDLSAARNELMRHLEAAQVENSPRRASADACQFCRAKAICPEASATALSIVKPMNLAVELLTPEQLGKRLDAIKFAEGVFEAWKDDARELLAHDPNAIPGWKLKPGATRRVVTSARDAFKAFSGLLTPEQFNAACSVSIGDLEKAYRAGFGCTAAAAKKKVNTLLSAAGLIEEKQNLPSLERVK